MDGIAPRGLTDIGNDADQPCVAILLSTFNGQPYLAEQLASLTMQTHTNWRMFSRDDGSTDQTTAVMADFAAALGRERFAACPENRRMRTTRSFLSLLRLALRDESTAYFAFADQDDIWMPDKLSHGIAALQNLPPEHPALYFCARSLVDTHLTPLGQVPTPRRKPGFPAALTQNLASGCCMMLNRAAAKLIDATEPPEETWHDWWSYIVVSAMGGTVIAGDTPDILYRQHGQNLIGEPCGFWHRAVYAMRRGPAPFMTLFWGQVTALRTAPIPLPDRTRAALAIIQRGQGGGLLARLKALCVPGLVRQTWAETLVFRLWFLLDRRRRGPGVPD
jgi:hypothetical protein